MDPRYTYHYREPDPPSTGCVVALILLGLVAWELGKLALRHLAS